MSIDQAPQCMTCAHYQGGLTCKAFPDGIPPAILRGEEDHTQPIAGDHGVRYEQTKEIQHA